MNEILFNYQKVDPTTWAYLSSLLIIGLFFKFGRFWSVRNLDLVLLILLAPGLLLVSEGQETQRTALAATHAEAKKKQEAIESAGTADETLETVSTPGDASGSADGLPSADASGRRDRKPVSRPTADRQPIPSENDASQQPEGRRSKELPVEQNQQATGQDGANDKAAAPKELTSAQQEIVRGRRVERIGFLWLLAAGALVLIRLLVDPIMVRRPLLEPNMTTGGLIFSCCSLFVFLMANVIVSRPTSDDLRGPISAERLVSRRATDDLDRHGPGYALVFMLPSLPTVKMGVNLARQRVDDPAVRMRRCRYYSEDGKPLNGVEAEYLKITPDQVVQLRRRDGVELAVAMDNLSNEDQAFVQKIKAYTIVAKLVALLSHLAIVIGIIAIGYWHFNNVKMGVGAATLYLMLPYTAQMTGRVDHVLPAALLIWAVLCYRRPLASGIFVGLAIGVVYYPLFLLPLWFSFYWQRGLMRFATGVVVMLTIMVLTLAFVSPDIASFWQYIREMFGLRPPQMEGLSGIWGSSWTPVYRYPVLAAFVALCGSLALWPPQKNLGTLISCSAAVMVATQFWHGYGGGLYLGWYLPLLLLTIFRPNLEDRVALSVLDEGWRPSRWRAPVTRVDLAA